MKWIDVRKLYPNQFVKLKVLSSYIENQQEIIEDVAVIAPISDELATKELLKSKGDELVYHTIHESIILEIRQDVGFQLQMNRKN
jgi:RNA-binding protein YhbY